MCGARYNVDIDGMWWCGARHSVDIDESCVQSNVLNFDVEIDCFDNFDVEMGCVVPDTMSTLMGCGSK